MGSKSTLLSKILLFFKTKLQPQHNSKHYKEIQSVKKKLNFVLQNKTEAYQYKLFQISRVLSFLIIKQSLLFELYSQQSTEMLVQEQNPKTLLSHYQSLKKNQLKRFKLSYQYPARLSVAEHHQASKRICTAPESNSDGNSHQLCTCCQLPIQKQQIQICPYLFQADSDQNSTQRSRSRYSRSNVAIVFTILKIVTAFYLVRTLLAETIKLILFKGSRYCGENQSNCKLSSLNDFITLPYLIYGTPQLLQTQTIINGFLIGTSIVFFVFCRYFVVRQYNLISSQNYSQEQYSIFVDNVSYLSLIQAEVNEENKSILLNASEKKPISLEELCIDRADLPYTSSPEALIKSSLELYFIGLVIKIKNKLEKKFNEDVQMSQTQQRLFNKLKSISSQNLKQKLVQGIVLCYDLAEIERLEELIAKTMLQIRQYKEDKQYIDATSLNYIPNRVKFLAEKLRLLQANYSQSISAELFLSRFLGCAFVTFQFSELKDYLIDFHQNNLRVFYNDPKFLSLKEPHVPQNLNWTNLKTTAAQNLRFQHDKLLAISIFFTLLITLIALVKVFCFNSTSLIVNLGSQTEVTSQFEILVLLSLIMFVSYNLLNKFIEENLKGQLKLIVSKNDYLTLRLTKGSVFSFLLLTITAIIFSQAYKRGLTASKQALENIVVSFGLFLLFQTFWHMIPASYIGLSIKKAQYSAQEPTYKFQSNLNRELEHKQFDLVQVLIFQLAIIFFTSFFYHIASINVFTSAILLILNYWVFKIQLIRFCNVPDRVTLKLVKYFIHILELQVIILAFGYFLSIPNLGQAVKKKKFRNIFKFNGSNHQYALLQLLITLLYRIITTFWHKRVHINPLKRSLTFTQAFETFPYFYEVQNPASKFTFPNYTDTKLSSRFNLGNDVLSEIHGQRNSIHGQRNSIDVSKQYSTKKGKGSQKKFNKSYK